MKKFTEKTQLILDSVQAGEQGIAMQANRYNQAQGAKVGNSCNKLKGSAKLYDQCVYDEIYKKKNQGISEQRATADDVRGIKDTSGLIAFFKSLMKKKDDDEENGVNENYDQLDEWKIPKWLKDAAKDLLVPVVKNAADTVTDAVTGAGTGIMKAADATKAAAKNSVEETKAAAKAELARRVTNAPLRQEVANKQKKAIVDKLVSLTDDTPAIRKGRRTPGGKVADTDARGEAAGRAERNIGRITDPLDDVLSGIGGTNSRMRASGPRDQRGTIGNIAARGLRAAHMITGKEVPKGSQTLPQKAYRFMFGEPTRDAIPGAAAPKFSERAAEILMGTSRQDRPILAFDIPGSGLARRYATMTARGAGIGTVGSAALSAYDELERATTDPKADFPLQTFDRKNITVDPGRSRLTQMHPTSLAVDAVVDLAISPEVRQFVRDKTLGSKPASVILPGAADAVDMLTGVQVKLPKETVIRHKEEREKERKRQQTSGAGSPPPNPDGSRQFRVESVNRIIERVTQDDPSQLPGRPDGTSVLERAAQRIADELKRAKEKGEEVFDAGRERVDAGRERTTDAIDNINNRIGDTVNRADTPLKKIADFLQKLIPQDMDMSLDMLGGKMKAAIKSIKTQSEKIPELAALKKEMQAYKPNLSRRPNIGSAPKYRKRVNTKGF